VVDARFAIPFLLFVLNGGILFEQMACPLQSVKEKNAAYLGKWMLAGNSQQRGPTCKKKQQLQHSEPLRMNLMLFKSSGLGWEAPKELKGEYSINIYKYK
jgi:hypothetical protein